MQLPFFISFWRALKNKKIIKPNLFCQPHIWTFWYFEISVWSDEKSHAFQGCAKIVLRLHTARAKNPDTPKPHPSNSNFHEYHSDILWPPPGITPDTSQTSQETRYANRRQQTPTDTKSQPQTPQDTDGCCLSMFGGVFWHLLVSLVSWWCLGGVWGMSRLSEWCLGGVGGYLGGIYGNWMCSDVFWVLTPCSMEP